MSTIYILFALYASSSGSTTWRQEFNSQGACIMAMNEGTRKRMFDEAMCVPKG